MDILAILMEAVKGSIVNVYQIAIIVIPLMIFVEIFKDLNLLDKLTMVITPLTRVCGISREGNLPILAGLLFGIGYGGGIIINSTREGNLGYKDIYLINLFLVICHSILEDTILFAAIGARWLPILLIRFMVAVLICNFTMRFTRFRKCRNEGIAI